MENKEQVPNWVYQLQTKLIGQRFAGASLCNTRAGEEDLRRINEWIKKKKGILVLMGRPGCGKTYICSALISWMYSKVSDLYFHKEDKFFEKIRASMEMKGDYHKEIEYQCDHEFLVIDDIGSIGSGKSDWRQEVYYSVVNSRYESQQPTVFSTNYTKDECFEKLGARTHSRLFAKENTVIDMFGYPDLRMQD